MRGKKIVILSICTAPILLSVPINKNKEVSAQEVPAIETPADVSFLEGDSQPPIVDPGGVDPIEPYPPAGPGTSGPLSVDFVSNFNFGARKISDEDKGYNAMAQEIKSEESSRRYINNFLQVTDQRGTGEGWELSVRQTSQFKSTEMVKYSVLKGSYLKLTNPVVKAKGSKLQNVPLKKAPISKEDIKITPETETVILTAEKNAGLGTWSNQWGEKTKKTLLDSEKGIKKMVHETEDIKLMVPGETPKSATTYTAELVWTLKSPIGSVE